MSTNREKPVCTACGGDDVRFDAYAGWNVATQDYELISTHDNPVCEDCGGECGVEWVDVE